MLCFGEVIVIEQGGFNEVHKIVLLIQVCISFILSPSRSLDRIVCLPIFHSSFVALCVCLIEFLH